VDLPTYTNIWRIEKRLYKLYDFRLPAPLPITWIAVFAGITVPYVFFLVAIGLPFNHNLVWLYILPPGVLTWLTTRPVIESKRLPELVGSQLRYLAEPRAWCRMAPFAEKDDIFLYARVWRRHPPQARPETALVRARPDGRAKQGALVKPGGRAQPAVVTQSAAPVRVTASPVATIPAASWQAAPSPQTPAPPRSAHPSAVPPSAARPSAAELPVADPSQASQPVVSQSSQPTSPPSVAPPSFPPEALPLPVPQRATAQARAKGTRAARRWHFAPGSSSPPSAPADEPRPGVVQRRAWVVPPPGQRQDSRALEVSHDSEPDPGELGRPRSVPFSPPAWPSSGASSLPRADAFPEVDAFPDADLSPEADASGELEPLPDPDPSSVVYRAEPATSAAPAADEPRTAAPAPGRSAPARPLPATSGPAAPARIAPARVQAAPATRGRSIGAKVAAIFVDLDGDRSVPSVDRALSGPGSGGDTNWRHRVKVVAGGQGPGQRDRETLDRDRARLPLDDPRRIAVLGCTSGAGQSVTALMTGHILAAVREVRVAALDLYPGDASLAAHIAPATSATALLAGGPDRADSAAGSARGDSKMRRARRESAARLDVIAGGSPGGNGARALDPADYQRLADLLAARYPLTMIDPAPSELTRILWLADQLVLVVPANADGATSLANTQQWLSAHGYDQLAARAVTVINGVSQRTSQGVLQAESVARGRCRAIVRVPWDDLLSVRPDAPAALHPQARRAYTALAGVIVAGLAADSRTSVPGRSPGEHSD
jgi:MinD-like ATPase involved in chromosome partitioning or flagellar assembly